MEPILFFDIETIANRAQYTRAMAIEPPEPDGRAKNPDSIAASIEKKTEQAWDRAALNADLSSIYSIGYSIGLDASVKVLVLDEDGTEEQLLADFWEAYARCDGRSAGYNIIGFDFPFLLRRSFALNVRPTLIPDLRKYQISPTLDLMQVFANWDVRAFRSLKWIASFYRLPMLEGAEGLDGSQVAGMDPATVRLYQESDVRLVRALFERMNGVYWPLMQ